MCSSYYGMPTKAVLRSFVIIPTSQPWDGKSERTPFTFPIFGVVVDFSCEFNAN